MANLSAKWRIVFPLIWLVYLCFPVVTMFHRPAPDNGVGLTGIGVFLVSYLLSWWDKKRIVYYLLIEITMVFFLSIKFDAVFLYLIFYISPGLAFLPSQKKYWTFSGLLLALVVIFFAYAYPTLSTTELLNLLPATIVALIMPLGIRMGVRSRELKDQLYLAQEEIARLSKREERLRISRDLHDTLGHTLSLITLKSELVEKLIVKNPEKAILEAKDIQNTSRAALKQVRELVSDMAAVSIREELDSAEQILAAASIELKVTGKELEQNVQPFVRNILGMCLRESITNVVKHSKASRCLIEFRHEDDQLTMSVWDDGQGINRSSAGAITLGRGLLGMKERLELIDGQLDISMHPQGGTYMTVTVPTIIRNQKVGAV